MEPENTSSPNEDGGVAEALAGAPRLELDELPFVLFDKLQSWLEVAVAMLPNLVAALIVFTFFWFLARGSAAVARRALSRISNNEGVNRLLVVIVRVALTSVGLFVALGMLNLDKVVTSLLAGVGVVGLALGFAFQDIAANFMSGVIMAVSRPFAVGDLVQTGDHFGIVEAIDLRTVHLRTVTGERVLIPNKDVYNNSLVNYTETPHRRVDVAVGVAYGDDLVTARDAAVQALETLPMRNQNRPVEVFYEGFGDSSIDFVARFWIEFSAQRDYLHARSEAVIALKRGLDAAGITIPFPIRTLDFGARAVGGESLSNELRDRQSA